MNRNVDPASGAAPAHRYNLVPFTTNLKTRTQSCRIAVRADHEKCDQSNEDRRPFLGFRMSFVHAQSEVPMISREFVRLTDHWRLKTDNSQRSGRLLFPCAIRRHSTTGLLEQMP